MFSRRAMPFACLFLALGLFVSGCQGQELVEPSSTYKTLGTQDYEFQVVWEVSLEALRQLGFKVRSKDRSQDDRSATIISEMKILKVVQLEGDEFADRLKIQIKPGSSTEHGITLAASRWKRKVDPREGAHLWEFVGTSEGVHDEFEKALEAQFSKRYKNK